MCERLRLTIWNMKVMWGVPY